MTPISHHPPDDLIRAYAEGRLPDPFAVVVAAHASICDDCRAGIETLDMLGGALLEGLEGAAIDAGTRARVMETLDHAAPPAPPISGSGVFPAPVMQALKGHPPRWHPLGGGIRQQILAAGRDGSLRLLYIPAGRAVPQHGHRGLELTLVLQGSFSDEAGRFARGDVETAHDEVDHQPVAGPGQPCICLAATDAPLRFRSIVPRLLQPLFRI